jgi:PAS domain S-box-containing protein
MTQHMTTALPTASIAESSAGNQRSVVLWTLYALVSVLLAWLAGEWTAQREKGIQVEAIHRTIEVQAMGLRGTVARYNQIPFVTAQHADIKALLHSPRDKTLTNQVNRFLQATSRQVGADALYLMDARGVTLAASNWLETESFVGDNYSFRPYFLDAMAGHDGFFYAVGTSTGVPGLFMTTAVHMGDEAIGVLAIKVSLRDIEDTWRRNKAPVFLTDAHGIVFLGSIEAWKYKTTHALQANELAQVNKQRQYGAHAAFEPIQWQQKRDESEASFETLAVIDGKPQRLLSLDENLPEFQWKLVVMNDLSPVNWARWMGRALAVLLALVLLLAIKVAHQRERRYVEMHTHRRELEIRVLERTAELQEAHAFRKAMGDSLVVGMHARDLQGRIIYVNPALCDITGYPADALVGQPPPYPYWHPEDLEKHWQYFEAVLSGQNTMNGFESRIRHRDGHDVYTMFYSAPLIDGTGKHSGWMSSVVDITDQKRAEEQQRVQAAKMQRSGRLATMGEMASTLAHELSQPLMALGSFAGAARAYAERGHRELLNETLSDISAQAQRAAEIVGRIRGFVRQQTPGFQDCTVNEVVNNVLALMRPEIRHQQARVITQLDTKLPTIQADRVLLEQVVLNLVLNALQAMQDKYPVDKVVRVQTGAQDDMVYIRVSDRGPGIAQPVVAQLFEPFFTTKPDGLGLGLNICRTSVESHRGRLEFENGPHGGAVFTVYLPLES